MRCIQDTLHQSNPIGIGAGMLLALADLQRRIENEFVAQVLAHLRLQGAFDDTFFSERNIDSNSPCVVEPLTR